jgi:hypothetical protein
MPCTTEDLISMDYFLFLFVQAKNVARLFWTIPVFEFFLVILETLPVHCYFKNSTSVRRVSAANRVYKDTDIFRKSIISLKQISR